MFPKDDRGIEFYDPAGEDNVKAPIPAPKYTPLEKREAINYAIREMKSINQRLYEAEIRCISIGMTPDNLIEDQNRLTKKIAILESMKEEIHDA